MFISRRTAFGEQIWGMLDPKIIAKEDIEQIQLQTKNDKRPNQEKPSTILHKL